MSLIALVSHIFGAVASRTHACTEAEIAVDAAAAITALTRKLRPCGVSCHGNKSRREIGSMMTSDEGRELGSRAERGAICAYETEQSWANKKGEREREERETVELAKS